MSSGYIEVMPLSRGGMASVQLVLRRSQSFTQLFARKRPHAYFQDEPEYREMFFEEARVAALISHPNVVSVIDSGEDDQGPFLIMEFVQGFSVSQLMRRIGQPLPVSLALRIAADAAAGLHAVHELVDREGRPVRLVHRDVSPQNLLVDFNGTTKLADFGIAKVLGDKHAGTATALLKGKPGYWSPEQLRLTKLDRRSDLFALGIVLFEMLAGRRLYGGTPEESALRVLEEPPPDLGEVRDDVPDEVEELLFELLAKDVSLRPATAEIVRERLEASLADLPLEPLRLDSFLESQVGDTIAERRRVIREAVSRVLGSAGVAPAAEPSTEPETRVSGARVANRSRKKVLGAAGILVMSSLGAAAAAGYHLGSEPFPAGFGDAARPPEKAPPAAPEPQTSTDVHEPRPPNDAGVVATGPAEAPTAPVRHRRRTERRLRDRGKSASRPADVPWWDRN